MAISNDSGDNSMTLGLRPQFFSQSLPLTTVLARPITAYMMDVPPLGEAFLISVGAPMEVFPADSWGSVPDLGTCPTNLIEQFGMLPIPVEPGASAAHSQAFRMNFQQLNQDWILLRHPASDITDAQPQPYQVLTLADKFHELSRSSASVGALAIIQWVTSTSDGGEPQFSQLVALVLSPLLTPPTTSRDVGYDLAELGLDFHVAMKPLGKSWPSHHIYPLIMPMF